MSSRSTNNKRSQGGRGRGRGRGRGGRGGRGGRNKKFVKAKPVCAPKYEGPMVGSTEYLLQQSSSIPHDFSNYDAVPEEFMPQNVKHMNPRDIKYQELQQKMMDFGWRLNEDEDDRQYFTHPTYQGSEYDVYYHQLTNGNSICLPLVNRGEDPKGLGCTVITTHGTGFSTVETNEWKSYWDNRSGKRKARYLNYLDSRQKKRQEFVEMAKKDSSVTVWEKDTPRCDPLTWRYNNPSLVQEAY